MTALFPLQENGYVYCPSDLFYWFREQSCDAHWNYFESPESVKEFTETVTVLRPYYDNFKCRTCYRKVQEERFDEDSYYMSAASTPDKLDACYSAYIYLSQTDCDWVTPDRFLVSFSR